MVSQNKKRKKQKLKSLAQPKRKKNAALRKKQDVALQKKQLIKKLSHKLLISWKASLFRGAFFFLSNRRLAANFKNNHPSGNIEPSLADVELIPREALFGNPERAGVQLSPDGQYLSWIAPVDGTMNVWVAPANDPGAAG